MQPRDWPAIPHPGPLGIASEDPWIAGLLPSAERRWRSPGRVGRVRPAFELVDDGPLAVVVGRVPRGTNYLIRRSARAIAAVVTIGEHVRTTKLRIQRQVLAQALGAGVGLPVLGPGVMARFPRDVHAIVTARSTPAERVAFKQRLRLHMLEGIRLNEVRDVVADDGRVIRKRF